MADNLFDLELRLLLEAIYEKYNYDFRHYSRNSIQRRLQTALIKFQLKTLSALQDRILHEDDFFPQLLQFLTVPTSEMFRDPSFFHSVRTRVVPTLRTYPSLKIWIAGCSTGEEVYTYAILLKEEGLLERTTLYATDINPESIKKAEQGIFPLSRMAEFTTNYQQAGGIKSFSDYFTAHYEAAIFDKSLKKNVVFADHSLATDSVFSEVQMVSCRNVMIYFDRDLQNRALGLFYDSLSPRGFLGLGSKESLRFSQLNSEFEELVPRDKIYRRKK